MRVDITPKDVQRFLSKVDTSRPDGCWPWMGACWKSSGYGAFWFAGENIAASRFALMVATGDDPEDMEACHTCDNPPCCRADHLFWGTRAANAADRHAKGRETSGDAHWTHKEPGRVRRGEANGYAKLTTEAVLSLRQEYAAYVQEHGRSKQRDNGAMAWVAERHHITRRQAYNVVMRKQWTHLP